MSVKVVSWWIHQIVPVLITLATVSTHLNTAICTKSQIAAESIQSQTKLISILPLLKKTNSIQNSLRNNSSATNINQNYSRIFTTPPHHLLNSQKRKRRPPVPPFKTRSEKLQDPIPTFSKLQDVTTKSLSVAQLRRISSSHLNSPLKHSLRSGETAMKKLCHPSSCKYINKCRIPNKSKRRLFSINSHKLHKRHQLH